MYAWRVCVHAQGLQVLGILKRYCALTCGDGGGLGVRPRDVGSAGTAWRESIRADAEGGGTKAGGVGGDELRVPGSSEGKSASLRSEDAGDAGVQVAPKRQKVDA